MKSEKNNNRKPVFTRAYTSLFIASIILLIIFLIYIVLNALYNATNISTYAANGTFQLYNPLRRLFDGQIVGVDFPFFHGIGMPLLHYPLYLIAGHGLFAAELAKWLITPLFFFISTSLFFYSYFRNVRKTIIATALFTSITILSFILVNPLLGLVYPGNSLLGLRTTFPVIIAAILLWQFKHQIKIGSYKIRPNTIIVLPTLAIAFIVSTEQGLSAIAAYIIIELSRLLYAKSHTIKAILNVLLKSLLIILFIFVGLAIITLGRPVDPLVYALINVPADQGWYFGAPPNLYLNLSSIPIAFFSQNLIYFYLLLSLGLVSFILFIKKNGINFAERHFVFMFMTAYGLLSFGVSTLGYLNPESQLMALVRMIGLILVIYWFNYFSKTLSLKRIKKAHLIVYGTAFALMLSSSLVYVIKTIDLPVRDTLHKTFLAPNNNDYFSSNQEWKNRIDSFRKYFSKDTSVWSTYAGLYESELTKSLHPSTGGEDYIIHALGKERREQYVKDFIDGHYTYATTLRPVYFIYEEWLLASNWTFYEYLFKNYEIIDQNDTHFLWKIKSNSQPITENSVDLKQPYRLPDNKTSEAKLYTVTVNYHASSGLLKPLDRIPRYLIKLNNLSQLKDISLPPQETNWTFPIIMMPGEKGKELQIRADSILPTAKLEINNLKIKEVETSKQNQIFFLNNYCASVKRFNNDPRCTSETLLIRN